MLYNESRQVYNTFKTLPDGLLNFCWDLWKTYLRLGCAECYGYALSAMSSDHLVLLIIVVWCSTQYYLLLNKLRGMGQE